MQVFDLAKIEEQYRLYKEKRQSKINMEQEQAESKRLAEEAKQRHTNDKALRKVKTRVEHTCNHYGVVIPKGTFCMTQKVSNKDITEKYKTAVNTITSFFDVPEYYCLTCTPQEA